MTFKSTRFRIRLGGARLLCATLAVVAVLAAAPVTQACPNCKDTVAIASEGTAEGSTRPAASQSIAAGYNYSILFMIGAMYAVVGSFIGGTAYYLRKNSAKINRT